MKITETSYDGTGIRFRGAHSPYMPALALFVKDVFDAEGLSELYVADLVTLMYASNFYAVDVHRSAAHQQVTRTFQNGAQIGSEGVLTLRDEGAKGIYQKSKKIVLEEGTLETVEAPEPMVSAPSEARAERGTYQAPSAAVRQSAGAPHEVRLGAGLAQPLERPRLAPRQSPVARMDGAPRQAPVPQNQPATSTISEFGSVLATLTDMERKIQDLKELQRTEREICYGRMVAFGRVLEFERLAGDRSLPNDEQGVSLRLDRLDQLRQDNEDLLWMCSWLFRAVNVEPPIKIREIMARRGIDL